MKTVIFQDFKKSRQLGWNVDQFLAEQEGAHELANDQEDFEVIADDA